MAWLEIDDPSLFKKLVIEHRSWIWGKDMRRNGLDPICHQPNEVSLKTPGPSPFEPKRPSWPLIICRAHGPRGLTFHIFSTLFCTFLTLAKDSPLMVSKPMKRLWQPARFHLVEERQMFDDIGRDGGAPFETRRLDRPDEIGGPCGISDKIIVDEEDMPRPPGSDFGDYFLDGFVAIRNLI